MRPFITFFDLDGTIMEASSIYSGTQQLVCDISASGILVALCSARPAWSMRRVAAQLGYVDYLAAFQGMEILRRHDQSWYIVSEHRIDARALRELVQKLQGSAYDVWAYGSNSWYVTKLTDVARREAHIVRLAPRPIAELPPCEVIRKIVVPCNVGDKRIVSIIEMIARAHRLSVSRSSPIYLELASNLGGSDKGFSEICQHAEVNPGDTFAVGNEANDERMLLAAGMAIALPPLSRTICGSRVVCLDVSGARAIATLRSLLEPVMRDN